MPLTLDYIQAVLTPFGPPTDHHQEHHHIRLNNHTKLDQLEATEHMMVSAATAAITGQPLHLPDTYQEIHISAAYKQPGGASWIIHDIRWSNDTIPPTMDESIGFAGVSTIKTQKFHHPPAATHQSAIAAPQQAKDCDALKQLRFSLRPPAFATGIPELDRLAMRPQPPSIVITADIPADHPKLLHLATRRQVIAT